MGSMREFIGLATRSRSKKKPVEGGIQLVDDRPRR